MDWQEVMSRLEPLRRQWDLAVLAHLADGARRPADLLAAINGQARGRQLTRQLRWKVLVDTLRRLETEGYVAHTAIPHVPRETHYWLLPPARHLLEAVDQLSIWYDTGGGPQPGSPEPGAGTRPGGPGVQPGAHPGRQAEPVPAGLSRGETGTTRHQPGASGDSPGTFNAQVPSIARAYNYLLGGKDNFAADRDLADKILHVYPATAVLARESRAFLGRAVGHVAAQQVSQFIDVGAGLPVSPAVHEIARAANPAARVVYVDIDPMAVLHASAVLADDSVAAVAGDMRDPPAILADPALARLTDLDEPACVILTMVLHFADPEQAARIVAGFGAALVPGSYIILSVGVGDDPGLGSRFADAYTAGTLHPHSREQVAGYFAGFDLIEPGITDSRHWRAPAGPDAADGRPAIVLAGVGRKAP